MPAKRGKRDAIRLLMAAIKQKEVDERIVLDDGQVVAVIDKMLKQRRDSITQYEAARTPGSGRCREIRGGTVDRLHAGGAFRRRNRRCCWPPLLPKSEPPVPGDMGKVMAVLKPKLAGRADMSEVSKLVKARLTGA